EDTSRDVPAVSEGRKVRIEGAEGAAATPLEEFRRLLGQLEQQYMAALSSNVQNAQGPQRPQGGKELEAENSTSSAIGIPPFDSQLATIRTSDEPAPSAGADVSYSGESEAESSQ
ncbi:unnamed protein product, partial [Cladocopium goreaui]